MNEPRHVLIVDDDPDFVAAVTALLESGGYRVTSTGNGTEGFDLARRVRPHIILLDVMMTERTEGFFLLQRLRRTPETAPTPIIMISSIYSELPYFRVTPEADWLPADLFIPKPVDPARLLAEVARLVRTDAPAATRTEA